MRRRKTAKQMAGGAVVGAGLGGVASYAAGGMGLAVAGTALSITWPVVVSAGAVVDAAVVAVRVVGRKDHGR